MLNWVNNICNLVFVAKEILLDEFVILRKKNSKIGVSVNPANDLFAVVLALDFFMYIFPCFMGEL